VAAQASRALRRALSGRSSHPEIMARVPARRIRPRSFGVWLGLIVVGAFAGRLLYVLVVMDGDDLRGDGRQFHYLANVLAGEGRYLQPFRFLFGDGEAIATAEKPPLYPAVLALPSLLGLDSFGAHQVVSCLMGAATVGVIGLLGRRVGGDRAGLVAAALAAAYPALWMLDASLRSESLYALLVALALLFAYRLLDLPRPGRALALGIVVGLAALTRGEALALLLLLVLPLLWLLERERRVRTGAVVLAGCLLVAGPWMARNWIVFDRPAAISTNEGGLLAGANCEAAYYSPLIGTWPCFPDPPPEWGTNEAEISSRFRSRALEYAGEHAGRVPAVVGVRVLRVWDVWDVSDAALLESQIADRHLRAQQAAVYALWALLPLAAAGAMLLRRSGRPLRILLATPVLVTATAALTYGSTRFRVAAEPALVVLAAVAIRAAAARMPWVRGQPDHARSHSLA
jgi:4-amino-4-deoxy-L-arabinose transferase-like glycosyltransferase